MAAEEQRSAGNDYRKRRFSAASTSADSPVDMESIAPPCASVQDETGEFVTENVAVYVSAGSRYDLPIALPQAPPSEKSFAKGNATCETPQSVNSLEEILPDPEQLPSKFHKPQNYVCFWDANNDIDIDRIPCVKSILGNATMNAITRDLKEVHPGDSVPPHSNHRKKNAKGFWNDGLKRVCWSFYCPELEFFFTPRWYKDLPQRETPAVTTEPFALSPLQAPPRFLAMGGKRKPPRLTRSRSSPIKRKRGRPRIPDGPTDRREARQHMHREHRQLDAKLLIAQQQWPQFVSQSNWIFEQARQPQTPPRVARPTVPRNW